MSPQVIIIGGGIGGLCLAHGLKKHNIPFHIYERDTAKDYRAQGYRIRIAREAVPALQYLLDNETWRLFELTGGELKLRPIPEIDATSGRVDEPNVSGESVAAGGSRYTVDRTLFRAVLLRGLERDITWGRALERYEVDEDNVTAFFKDGTSAQGSLLVGADGAHSIVRRQLLPNHPILDTGGRCIYGKTLLTEDVVNSLEPTITAGGMLAIKDRSRNEILSTVVEPVIFHNVTEITKQGFACPHNYIYWVMSTQPNVLDQQGNEKSLTPEQLALQLAQKWHPAVRAMIDNQIPDQTAVLPINSVPSDFGTWEPNERVTCIGDAVHLMGPTAGSGAITALRDAHVLCEILAKDGQSKEAIAEYEQKMRQYASEIVAKSWSAAKYIFGQTAGDDKHIGEVMMANRAGSGSDESCESNIK